MKIFNTRWKPLSTLPLSELECFHNLQLPIPWHGLPQGSQLPLPAPPGPHSWPFSLAISQLLTILALSSPSLAIACPLCSLSSTPRPQGALIQNSSSPARTCKLATLPLPCPSSPLSPPSPHSLGSPVIISATPPSLFTPILGQTPAVVIVTCTISLPSIQTAEHPGEKHTTWLMSFTSNDCTPQRDSQCFSDVLVGSCWSIHCFLVALLRPITLCPHSQLLTVLPVSLKKSTEETSLPSPHPSTPHTQLRQHPCALPPLLSLWVNSFSHSSESQSLHLS